MDRPRKRNRRESLRCNHIAEEPEQGRDDPADETHAVKSEPAQEHCGGGESRFRETPLTCSDKPEDPKKCAVAERVREDRDDVGVVERMAEWPVMRALMLRRVGTTQIERNRRSPQAEADEPDRE